MRSRVAIFAGAMTTTVALAAGCALPTARWVAPSETGDTAAGAGTLAWNDCTDKAREQAVSAPPLDLSFACATLTVPQDWSAVTNSAATGGKTINLALIRIRSGKQHDRIGSLLLNPGGPGASGVSFAVNIAGHLGTLAERFDLIGFDPRGVGESAPVKCISDADLDASFGYPPDPVSQASFDGAVALFKRIDQGCAAAYSDGLGIFATKQAAADMDAIRAAVGDEQINYLGYSYGTLLGAVYAQMFPTKIRAMVLDGPVDPRQSPIAASEAQAKGFERAFDNFVGWCKKNASACPISSDPRAAVTTAIADAERDPVRFQGRQATSGWVFYALIASLYSKDTWPYLGQAIANLQRGEARLTFLLADSYADRDTSGHYSNLFDANSAINCADSDAYPSVETIRSLQEDWRRKYPLFGAPLAIGLLSCSMWPAKPDPYPAGPANGAPPVLVIGTTGDPATPYEQTAALADLLGVGVVVTWEGEGHTAYPETRCVRTAVDKYLIDLSVPESGLTCPA